VRCPYCRQDSDRVVDSRAAGDGDAIRRRRECRACGRRFTTYERLEPVALTVRKRSGRNEPFDRAKLARGIARAVAGRAVAADAVDAVTDDVAAWSEAAGPEVGSDAIGLAVLERLRALDAVSYLRFASVYKGFEDLADFEAEVVELQRSMLEKATAPKPPEPDRA
jgi:transcriptional repressor NrdR